MYIKCLFLPKRLIPFQSLTIGKKYLLVGIEYGGYRVINDRGEPVVYKKGWFEKVSDYPKDWIKKKYEDGQYFIYPQELNDECFFEKWFDKEPDILQKFEKYINSIKNKTK